MGMRNWMLALTGLLLCNSPLLAEDNLMKGAFGFAFGEELSTEGRKLQYESRTGMRVYEVAKPPVPYDRLKSYTVQVTPDRRIFEITGAGRLDSIAACSDEREYIATVLSQRHPGVARIESQDPMIPRTVLRLQDQRVEIVCIDSDLSISYRDSRVLQPVAVELPDQPAIQSAGGAGGRDTSGL